MSNTNPYLAKKNKRKKKSVDQIIQEIPGREPIDLTNLEIEPGSSYGGTLQESWCFPEPVKVQLNTYHPVVSSDYWGDIDPPVYDMNPITQLGYNFRNRWNADYPWSGHSELLIFDGGDKPYTITKSGEDIDYQLFDNNCSDGTRRACESIFGEDMDPFLFTTPGDVRDFVSDHGPQPIWVSPGQQTQTFYIRYPKAKQIINKDIIFRSNALNNTIPDNDAKTWLKMKWKREKGELNEKRKKLWSPRPFVWQSGGKMLVSSKKSEECLETVRSILKKYSND